MFLWDGTSTVGSLTATETGRGRDDLEVPLHDAPADGATLRLLVSLETEEGTAAAAAAVG